MKKMILMSVAALILAGNVNLYAQNKTTTLGNIANGTAITLTIGDKVIPATLNETKTAKDLISKLPYKISLNRYSHDYCGNPSETLTYDEKDVQFGWRNGEISYEKQTPYFVIFFGDEENSQIHGNQIIIGKVDVDLDTIKGLGRQIDITIDLAK